MNLVDVSWWLSEERVMRNENIMIAVLAGWKHLDILTFFLHFPVKFGIIGWIHVLNEM